ncbi:MAG: universal stress protein [Deltaproteobacteria bacterium]|nr:universal stress protein [Deltaproteobacteria bacterium]
MPLLTLLGVDDSPYSRAARTVALDMLARFPGSQLTALRVVNVVGPSGRFLKDLPGRLGFEPAVVSKEVEEEYDEKARRLLAEVKLAAEEKGLEVRTVLDHGAVVERICHHAERADLTLIGNKGRTESRFPGQGGNNVYNILEAVSTPVVLVPEGAEDVTGVVLGFDGSNAAAHATKALRRLSEKIRFRVHVVYVDKGEGEPPGLFDRAKQQLPNVPVTTHLVQAARVREGVVKVAEEVEANLIAIGFRGNNRVKNFLFSSSADYLMTNKSFMVLVAH